MSEHRFQNRLDTAAVFIPMILLLFFRTVSALIGEDLKFLPEETEHGLRFLLVVPLLRFFSQVQGARHVVSTLMRILPSFMSLLIVMILVFYFYSIIGVHFFSGKLTSLNSANFNTMTDAMLALFQMLVGEVGLTILSVHRNFVKSYYQMWLYVNRTGMISCVRKTGYANVKQFQNIIFLIHR